MEQKPTVWAEVVLIAQPLIEDGNCLDVVDRPSLRHLSGDLPAELQVIDRRLEVIFDTLFVENHGSFEPHYQLETWRMSARVAAHFLAAGLEIPAAAGAAKPNAAQLWRTIRQVQSDSGEPFMPMAADRYHLIDDVVVRRPAEDGLAANDFKIP